MNKKAFTLIEIIVVIVIIGAILLFAIPTVTKTIENSKKDAMLNDAKDMVEKAKNYIISGKGSYPTTATNPTIIELNKLDSKKEIKQSPYGSDYDRDNSKVIITLSNGMYDFKVTLIDEKGNKIEDTLYPDLSGNNRYSKVKTEY